MINRSVTTLALLAVAAATLPGCHTSGRSARQGAVVGSLLGGVAGYQVGRHNSHRTKGAALGAIVGGLAGHAIGDAADDRRRERAEASYATERQPSYLERETYHTEYEDEVYEEAYDEPDVIVVEREVPVERRVIIRERHVPVRRRIVIRRPWHRHHHHHHHYRGW